MPGRTWRIAASLGIAAFACRDPPPPEPVELGTASTEAREQVDQATDVHEYLAAYRRVLRMELRPAEADRMLAVEVAGTRQGDSRFLALLATDHAARRFLPLALDAAGFRDEAAELRSGPAIADRAGAVRVGRQVTRLLARVARQREAQNEPHPGLLATVGLVLTETQAALDGLAEPAAPDATHAQNVARAFVSLLAVYPDPPSRDAVVGSGISLLRDLAAAARSGVNNGAPTPYPGPRGPVPPPPAEEGS